jgi:hypothetical protein
MRPRIEGFPFRARRNRGQSGSCPKARRRELGGIFVSDTDRSFRFFEAALAPLGIARMQSMLRGVTPFAIGIE